MNSISRIPPGPRLRSPVEFFLKYLVDWFIDNGVVSLSVDCVDIVEGQLVETVRELVNIAHSRVVYIPCVVSMVAVLGSC